ncbi:hypothetical protein [Lysobacter sp. HA35]
MAPFICHEPHRVAAAARNQSGLAVVFGLNARGAIDDEALVLYDGEPIARMPVALLPTLADRFPEADTHELRRTVATYHAERAGLRGNA